MKRIASLLSAGVAGTAVLMIALCCSGTSQRDSPHGERAVMAQSISSGVSVASDQDSDGTNHGLDEKGRSPSDAVRHAVVVRRPDGPPFIELAADDPQGRSGKVACSTCHSVRPPNPANRTSATLDEFHQGLKFSHGTLACYACHNPEQSDALRLADGSVVEYHDVMTLCSQCHAAQATSFRHGAHGGMNGYWDLSRGPQLKNNCVDCHDPHEPSYPKMIVGFKPRDRFLEAGAKHDDHE